MLRRNEHDLDRVLRELGISLDARHQGRSVRPGEKYEQDHWSVTLKRGPLGQGKKRAALKTEFHMGTGHHGAPPSAASVVHSLMSDGRAGEQSFEEFCSDFGYDEDSRQAEKIWKACKAIAPKIRTFLGADFDAVAEAAQDY